MEIQNNLKLNGNKVNDIDFPTMDLVVTDLWLHLGRFLFVT